MAYERNLAIGVGIAQGLEKAATNIYNIGEARKKTDMDKKLFDLTSKQKKLEIQKSEHLMSPEQLKLANEKMKLENQKMKTDYETAILAQDTARQENEINLKESERAGRMFDMMLGEGGGGDIENIEISDYVTPRGSVKPLSEMPKDTNKTNQRGMSGYEAYLTSSGKAGIRQISRTKQYQIDMDKAIQTIQAGGDIDEIMSDMQRKHPSMFSFSDKDNLRAVGEEVVASEEKPLVEDRYTELMEQHGDEETVYSILKTEGYRP